MVSGLHRSLLLVLFFGVASPGAFLHSRQTGEGGYYRKWLDQDVAYIITTEEREVFLRLTTDDERSKFIEQFWLRRDPDLTDVVNEFKDEHYRRIAYANTYFGSGIPGWRTDRGRIYIIHGPPSEIESNSGGAYERPRHEGGGRTSTFPFEIWRYRYIEGIGNDVEVEFVDRSLTGQYSLALDGSEKDALLRIPGAGLTLLEEAGAASKTDRVLGINQQQPFLQMGKRFQDQPFERMIRDVDLQRPPTIRFKELQRMVTARVIYRDLPIQVTWDHLWIDDKRVLLPITLRLPAGTLTYRRQEDASQPLASVQLYGRITGVGGQVAAEFEKEMSFSPADQGSGLLLQHQVLLSAGRYRMEVVLKDLVGEKFGTEAIGLVIPGEDAGRLKISSLLLARRIELLRPGESTLGPDVYGDVRVVPAPTSDFGQTDNVGLYFHVVGPAIVADGPLSVELVYQILRDGVVVEEIRDQEGLTIHQRREGRLVAFAFLSLRKLTVGGYTVVVVCREPGGAQAQVSREIRVL